MVDKIARNDSDSTGSAALRSYRGMEAVNELQTSVPASLLWMLFTYAVKSVSQLGRCRCYIKGPGGYASMMV